MNDTLASSSNPSIDSSTGSSRPFRWWHAVAIFVVANAISVLPAGINGDEAFYNNFTRPAIAPPDWLFLPMWLFLNITSLIGLGIVANSRRDTPGHKPVMTLEGVGWVLFALFDTLYFWMKSPILGAVDTAVGLIVALFSFALSWRIDRRAGVLIGLRVMWLLLATFVSAWVAFNNVDPFFAAFKK
jgi:translocator protein